MKNIIKGISTILDMFASSRPSIYSIYAKKADMDFLKEDWEKVAEDISFIFNIYNTKESLTIEDEQE